MQQSTAMDDDGLPSNTDKTRAEDLVSLAVQAGSNGGCNAKAVFTRFQAIVSMLADVFLQVAQSCAVGCRIHMHLSMSVFGSALQCAGQCGHRLCHDALPHPQLNDYREQSELLDPMLERLVAPLAAVLQTAAADVNLAAHGAACDHSGLWGVSRLLWTLATTRYAGVQNLDLFLIQMFAFLGSYCSIKQASWCTSLVRLASNPLRPPAELSYMFGCVTSHLSHYVREIASRILKHMASCGPPTITWCPYGWPNCPQGPQDREPLPTQCSCRPGACVGTAGAPA